MQYVVISYIYDDWKGSYKLLPASDVPNKTPFEECEECDRYMDTFDTYEDAKAFYDECVEQEGSRQQA